ncbi:MAG TPA: transglutaminase domain-containing protein [Ktedonobacteraceae bacterium]|nr:transglutaminase domain-containing protein [Ktedonobacteraceae bacterium]
MHDAGLERLTKLISTDPSSDGGKGLHSHKPFSVHLKLEEGWFSLFLVAVVIYSTIWSVQAAGWVEHLNALTLTTVIGLVIGVIASKQQRFSSWSIHLAVLVLGCLLAYWQTAGAFYHGNILLLFAGLRHWVLLALGNGTSNDDSIFLLLILLLGYLLAYVSAWLVYHTRTPWLMIVCNAVVLLINLNNLDTAYILYLLIFLLAALLLLLRFNLFESFKRWHKQGLRYADDIGWDFMQAGIFATIGLLVLSWLLPAYNNPALSGIWTTSSNPWVQAENTWNRIIALNGNGTPSNHGNFRNTLVLGGNPNLNQDIVFTVKTTGDGSQYLEFLSYDTYTTQGWSSSPLDKSNVDAHQIQAPLGTDTHTEKQTITVVNPPGEQDPYLGAASETTSMSVPATVFSSTSGAGAVAWEAKNGALPAKTMYTATSEVSSADVQALHSIPMSTSAPAYPQGIDAPSSPVYYDQNVLKAYLQLPGNLDPRIHALAQHITAKAPTMYDKALALETYLRSHYTYSVDIHRPADQDGVAWFLFNSGNRGFCNYFASAMAVMARSVGIPARVAAGYTHGTYDAKSQQWVIRGSDAHAWTQIYFAGYGWINFEPSQSFDTFTRPLPNQFSSSTGNTPGGITASGTPTANGVRKHIGDPVGNMQGHNVSTVVDAQTNIQQIVRFVLAGLVACVLVALLLFMLWWRRLFRRYDLASSVFGRLCLLASWAGVQIQPSQTPYEYVQALKASDPSEGEVLERLGNIYVRYRWADPESKEHPRQSGEMQELTGMWRSLQPRLFLNVVKHPHFLRMLPLQAKRALGGVRRKKRGPFSMEEEI